MMRIANVLVKDDPCLFVSLLKTSVLFLVLCVMPVVDESDFSLGHLKERIFRQRPIPFLDQSNLPPSFAEVLAVCLAVRR